MGVESTESLAAALATLPPSAQQGGRGAGSAAMNARLKAGGKLALGAETVAILELLLTAWPGE